MDKCLRDGDRAPIRVTIANRRIDGIAETYSDARRGALIALFESTGSLEIAVREGNAAELLQASRRTPISITRR